MSDVTALLVGPRGVAPPGAAQVAQLARADDLADAARAAKTELVWILAGGSIASPTTLPALLAHAGRPAASLPVDAEGRPVERLLGRFAGDEDATVLDEIAQRRVPLRHTPLVSLLAERALVARIDPPRTGVFGRYAGSEWSARLFAASAGVLVPASRVRASAPTGADPLRAVRTMRSGAWSHGDVLRELRRAVTA